MKYDVVLCTRNRPDSARTALEHIEKQSVKPERVIVIDASDDHQRAVDIMTSGRDPSIEWMTSESSERNLPYQRNLGLSMTQSPVVLMPDDDSMLYPGSAEEVLEIYRRDERGQIAAVSAKAASRHPSADATTQISLSSRIKDRIEPIRHRVELQTVPKPHLQFPTTLWPSREIPQWIDGDRFAIVESVSGFLMSVRAAPAKEVGFDPTMGYGIGYALHEDMEFSMNLQRAGYLIAAARRAAVFHDVHPSARAGGFSYGFCWLANYAYACSKNMREGRYGWRESLERFMRYKTRSYRVRATLTRNSYARDVARGAMVAWESRAALLDCEPDQLQSLYQKLCDVHIRR